jgi:hypothetical protein
MSQGYQQLVVRELTLHTNEDAAVQSSLIFPITTIPPGTTLSQWIKVIKAPKDGVLRFRDQTSDMDQTKDFIYYPAKNYNGKDSFVLEYTDPLVVSRLYRLYYTIAIAPVNDPPTLWAPSQVYAQPGRTLKTQVYALDDDNSTLTITATGLPAGAVFDPIKRVVTWSPESKNVGSYTVQLSASDGVTQVQRSLPIRVVAQRSPRKILYNGNAFPFVEGIGWDTNQSIAKEALAGTNKYIEYTLNNKNYWGAAAYSFTANSHTDLSAFAFMKLDLWAAPNVTVTLSLVDYFSGKESIRKSFALNSKAKTIQLNLQEFAARGFDLSKTTSLIISTSVATAQTFKVKVDNIIVEGNTKVALPSSFQPFAYIVHDSAAKGARMVIPNLGARKIEKIKWMIPNLPGAGPIAGWTTDIITTLPTVDLTSHSSCVNCRLYANVTVAGVEYAAVNWIGVPYIPKVAPLPDINAMDNVVDGDIQLNPLQSPAAYLRQVAQSLAAEKGEAKGLYLTTVPDEVRWLRGVIPYTMSGLSAPEITYIENFMNEIFTDTGVAFVNEANFSPGDNVFADKRVTIRLLQSTDLSGTTAQQNSKFERATCRVVGGLGNNAKEVLLKNSTTQICLFPGLPSRERGTVRHELYHVMGAAHEQKSPLVSAGTVQIDHIYPWDEDQFIGSSNLKDRTEFDVDSIMLYPRFASSICNSNAVNAAGTAIWDYSSIDPALDRIFQARINALSTACQRNDSAIFTASCQTECETIQGAPQTRPSVFSTRDVAGMRVLYPMNNEFRQVLNEVNASLAADQQLDRTAGANILGSLQKLVAEASLDRNLVSTSPEHRVAVETLNRAGNQRNVTWQSGCFTKPTNIVDGRKTCEDGPVCVNSSSVNSTFLPGLETFTISKLGEVKCTGSYSDGGRKFCLSTHARSGTANGSSGFVSCTYTLKEVDL